MAFGDRPFRPQNAMGLVYSIIGRKAMGGGVFELITSFPEKDSLRSFFKNRLVLIFYVSPTGDLLKNEDQFRLY